MIRIKTVRMDARQMNDECKKAGYSIRKLCRESGLSRTTLYNHLDRGSIPLEMYCRIRDILHPKSRTIWMRIGVSVPVTDEELAWFISISKNGHREIYGSDGFDDVYLEESIANDFLLRGTADGESYIPGCCLEEYASKT